MSGMLFSISKIECKNMKDKKKIGWGIFGTGNISHQFAQGLSRLPDAQLIGVASRKLESAQCFAKKFKAKFAYEGYEGLIRNPEVDVVYIATPNSKHKEHSLLCLNANKAVLCEKPFALNAQEAKEVIDLARSKRIFCMEAMWMRFMPLVRKAREFVKNGSIGEPQVLTVNFGESICFNTQENVFKSEMGGGSLLDLGVYGISLMVYLFGTPSHAAGRLIIGKSGIDELATISFEFPDGKIAIVNASLRCCFFNEAVISGSLGRIRLCEPFYRPHCLGITRYPKPFVKKQTHLRQSLLSRAEDQLWIRKLYLRLSHSFPFIKRFAEKQLVDFFKGNGFHYEAKEVMDCIYRGAYESEVMPLNDSLKILELMDSIRKQNNFYFPQEQAFV